MKRTNLKDLISEHAFDRKFGEPSPTLEDTINSHNGKSINEADIKLSKHWEEAVAEKQEELEDLFGDLEVLLNDNSHEDWFRTAYNHFDNATTAIESAMKKLKSISKKIKD